MPHRHRFYISPQNILNNVVLISQPGYHHIVDVLRYKECNKIGLFDGKGNEYTGKIESINYRDKSVKILLEKVCKEEVGRPLILVQGLVKSTSMDAIIQKATELGVTHIYPLITKNSVIRLESKEEFKKIGKWQRITEEASKQCDRNWLPYVDKIWNLDKALDSLGWIEKRIICTPSGKGKKLKEIPDGNPGSTAIMIGPEGDFTVEELDLVCSKGWIPVHLGETILRAETAAMAVLGAISYKFGYWD